MPQLQNKFQYTEEELEQAVKQNISILGTMKTLGAPLNSGTFRKKLTRLLQDYEIDTTHFLGKSWNNGKGINHIGGIPKKLVSPEDERRCTKCGVIKLAKEFYQRKKGPRVGAYYEKCKNCMKVRGRIYFHQNHERQSYLARVRKRRYTERAKKLVGEIKKGKFCLDCKRIYPPYMMDFDHREGEIKMGSVSNFTLILNSNLKRIEEEIAKCDLICANCHRIRTHKRIVKNTIVKKKDTKRVGLQSTVRK